MSALLQFAFDFQTITCCNCACTFAMSEAHYLRRRDDGKAFWCPNGHEQFFSESTVKRLEKELETEKKRHEWTKADLNYTRTKRDEYARKVVAQKAAKTRLKNRIANGVCPCCNRTFQNLVAHMKTQHPEFKEPNE